MKLNYKRTFLVGFAFLSICSFWQMYDTVIPLILRDTFGLGDGPAGIIMSLDNVVALFLIPLFGALSDKAGRRIPFIVGGTAAAVVLLVLIPILDNTYGVWSHATSTLVFIVVLGALLLAMGSYRSPAVALMPDVTPKPLRSKGNAVINLMGAAGGAFTLVVMRFLVLDGTNGRSNYLYLFLAVGVLMVLAALTVRIFVPERKLVQEMKDINYGVSEEEDQSKSIEVDGKQKLPPDVRRSLILILATITLWFMGYNAVTTAFSKYATKMWSSGLNNVSSCLLVATGAAVISYLPIGMLASRIGRKKTIIIGLIVAALCFTFGALFAQNFSAALYVMFAAVGFAQAAVTVNTFPMVWEISRFGNVGKYTGYYYTCSMAAQVVTPIVSGYLLQYVGYNTLFPYATLFVVLAIIPVALTKYGDSKPSAPKDKLEAMQGADD
ncbi:MAG TPA: MFS transporter [Eubacteriales bacterium]|nr:MFS transporter [Eubacteriales bacterium]